MHKVIGVAFGLWLLLLACTVHARESSGARDVPAHVTAPKNNFAVEGNGDVPAIPDGYRVTRDDWLTLAYPEHATERVASLVRDAASVKQLLVDALGVPVLDPTPGPGAVAASRRVEVRITPSVVEMKALAPVHSPPPEYASGVAYPALGLVLISMTEPRGIEATNLDDVFRHELAHIALEHAVRGHAVPVWFNEGFAVGFAGENTFERQRVLAMAAVSQRVFPLSELAQAFPGGSNEAGLAYAQSVDVLRFLQVGADRRRFQSAVGRVRDGQAFERAFADAYGTDLRTLEYQWRQDLHRRYALFPWIAGGGLVWGALVGVLVWIYVKRRRRAKRILASWALQEALEDARIAALMARESDERALPGLETAPPVPVKVELEGRWHTLH